jgi:hypothetical protein
MASEMSQEQLRSMLALVAVAIPTAADALREHCESLAREVAELRTINEHANRANMQAQHFRDCAESELAELKRKIAEAGKAAVHDDANLGPSLVAYMDATDLGKTFALLRLPLDDGGEG